MKRKLNFALMVSLGIGYQNICLSQATDRVAKFTGVGMNIVNSQITDNGTNVGIGTTSPNTTLDISVTTANSAYGINGSTVLQAYGPGNLFIGFSAGFNNTGQSNTFCGSGAGFINTSGMENF